MQFFTSPEDLRGWVKSQPTPDAAVSKIMGIFQEEQKGQPSDASGEQDIVETCKEIYTEDEDGNASNVLFGILAKHNLTQVKEAKGANDMNKTAQAVESRQRNNWVRGNRNKFNRVVDGFNEGTPWRVDRDKMFNFTHYYTDAISFDEDPNRVYSGEAIWRMYIMDKFTSDYQDKDGRVVGGYINDRFHRFPTAGTPANPDVDRCQGNQMELAPGERSRKPRPHQYSMERRLEEARDGKTEDMTAVVAQAKSVVKIASTQPIVKDDKVYDIFKDTIEMREAGIDYPTMLEAISNHYKSSIMGVAQIDKVAQDLKKKHDGIVYVASNLQKSALETIDGKQYQVGDELINAVDAQGQSINLISGTTLVRSGPTANTFVVVEDSTGTLTPNTPVTVQNIESLLSVDDGMNELSGEVEGNGSNNLMPKTTPPNPLDFPVEEVAAQNQ